MKRYQTQVSDWMTRDPVSISPDATLAMAWQLMQENEIRRLLVMDRELVGVITMSDILRTMPVAGTEADREKRLQMTTRTVRDVMTYDPVTVDPEDTIQEAAELMLEYEVSGLPVVSGQRPVGIITESDIFRLVVESWAEQRAD